MAKLRIDEPIDITITINVKARMQMDGDVEVITERILRDLALTPLKDELFKGQVKELTFSVRNNLTDVQEITKKDE